MKSKIIAAYNEGDMLILWYSSPLGDLGEPNCFKMKCLDAEQAQDMANYWFDSIDMPKHGVNA